MAEDERGGHLTPPVAVVVMGVAGSGKTTVGKGLAQALEWRFLDADNLHPPQNRAKLSAGEPLTDADRAPWLAQVRAAIAESLAKDASIVVACSALKDSYRRTLAEAGPLQLVYLSGPPELLHERISRRSGHFVPASLLDSQLETLEPPSDAWVLDIRESPAELVDGLVARLKKVGSGEPAG